MRTEIQGSHTVFPAQQDPDVSSSWTWVEGSLFKEALNMQDPWLKVGEETARTQGSYSNFVSSDFRGWEKDNRL